MCVGPRIARTGRPAAQDRCKRALRGSSTTGRWGIAIEDATRTHKVSPRRARGQAAHDSYVCAQCWTTCRLHSAGLAAAACKRSAEPAIATASAKTSAAHVVRGLPRFRRPSRPTLCCRASSMGVPTVLTEAFLAPRGPGRF